MGEVAIALGYSLRECGDQWGGQAARRCLPVTALTSGTELTARAPPITDTQPPHAITRDYHHYRQRTPAVQASSHQHAPQYPLSCGAKRAYVPRLRQPLLCTHSFIGDYTLQQTYMLEECAHLGSFCRAHRLCCCLCCRHHRHLRVRHHTLG